MLTTLAEIVFSVLQGESISALSFLKDAAIGLVVALLALSFFAPLLAGQVARLKLLREKGGLLLIGNLGVLATVAGTLVGLYFNIVGLPGVR